MSPTNSSNVSTSAAADMFVWRKEGQHDMIVTLHWISAFRVLGTLGL